MTETTHATTDQRATGVESHTCRVCGRAFPESRLLVLHRGVRHPSVLTGEEKEAYREAYREEEREIRSFRIRAFGVLVLLYFGYLFMYIWFAG
ncbi:hypothetical protein C499_02948 [Halogeometricum borinquense DSM 11551]|uniref:C2H2-type domain-containing protein n=2 Tax=Halogeometricum borinquense TaxID=60847 RepID=E4NQJ2_HALBP|nr:hypothetical protein [Halogeometricum borinquense]ADQ66680.1 hypothetical protein Hbor_10900 [Halogeometricum borinquense DSM 11551]ELY30189.1 hypothetical protein C499_02948 [Halogeometricum borinquense DSM 11551]RYJ14526.1 DNA-binding protein [Halogeometricum borinquense]